MFLMKGKQSIGAVAAGEQMAAAVGSEHGDRSRLQDR